MELPLTPPPALGLPPTAGPAAPAEVPAAVDAPAAGPAIAPDQATATGGQAALQQAAAGDLGGLPWGDALDAEGQALLARLDGNRFPGVATAISAALQDGRLDGPTAKALMQQVLDPDGRIQQLGQMSCVAATVQKVLATTDPAGYVRAAIDLMAAGETTLPTGAVLAPAPGNRDAAMQWPDPLSRLNGVMQAALMDHANGADAYDLLSDISTRDDGSTYRGVTEGQAAAVAAAVSNVPFLNARALDDLPLAAGLAQQLEAAKAAGAPGLLVPIRSEGGLRHLVLLTDLQPDVGIAGFLDARGQVGTMTDTAFLAAVALERQGALQADTIGSGTNRAASGPNMAGRSARPPAPPPPPPPPTGNTSG